MCNLISFNRQRDGRRLIRLLPVLLCLFFSFFLLLAPVNAEEEAVSLPYQPFAYDEITEDVPIVTILSDSVSLRADADSSSEIVAVASKNMSFTLLSEATAENGTVWYEVDTGYETEDGPLTGFLISNSKCRLDTLSASGVPFTNYLRLMGFPDDYAASLTALHAQYPNWLFWATETGLDWANSLYEEANPDYYLALGGCVSLIHINSIASYKHIKAYDYATGTWKATYDGPGWTLASDELVAYFLDPRNFLSEDGIFMFLNLLYNENQTAAGVEQIVAGTFMANANVPGTSKKYSQTLYEIGRDLGISPYYLAATIRQEVGVNGLTNNKSINGTSTLFPGYFNYYNIYAYTHDGMDANDAGLWYASGQGRGLTDYERPWNTHLKALRGGAQFHAYNYLLNYQYTLYYKKFNVVPGGATYRHQYMTNVMAAYSEAQHLKRAYTAASDEVLCFDIPVYLNMPSSPCPRPTDDRSPNDRLASIAADGQELYPALNTEDTVYYLATTAASITLKPQAVDSKAAVSGGGTISLTAGQTTTAAIKVTAENGSVRQYTVNIYRVSGTLYNTAYRVQDGWLSGISPGTTVSGAKAGITPAGGLSVRITNAAGAEKSSSALIGSGDAVSIIAPNGAAVQTLTVLIYGDVNGDGEIDLFDMVTLRNHILGTASLKSRFELAADVNTDGEIDLFDMVGIRNHILGKKTISQKP